MNVKTDFLVIGAGIAGLRAAIQLQKYGHVLMLVKRDLPECNTYHAAGGISCVWGEEVVVKY